jgi:hypothetical protein
VTQRLATALLCFKQTQHRLSAGSLVSPAELDTALRVVEESRKAAQTSSLKLDVNIVHPDKRPPCMCNVCGALIDDPRSPEDTLRSNPSLRAYYGISLDRLSDTWRNAVTSKRPALQADYEALLEKTSAPDSEPISAELPRSLTELVSTSDHARSGAETHRRVAKAAGVEVAPLPMTSDTASPMSMHQPPSAEARSINSAVGYLADGTPTTPPIKRFNESAEDAAIRRDAERRRIDSDPRTSSPFPPGTKQWPVI